MERMMSEKDAIAYFTRMKWPNGFRCPRCAHSQAYRIHTRRLPLYQCRLCRHQTTVVAGTFLTKSRTPLMKWCVTLQLLSNASGINAVQLAERIHVTYKTAWSMLHKIRLAINAIDAQQPLTGAVRGGIFFYGSPNLQPYVRHPQEHPIFVAKGDTYNDAFPPYIKMKPVFLRHMTEKTIKPSGEAAFVNRRVHPRAVYVGLLNRVRIRQEPLLLSAFREAKQWLNRTFRGIGRKYQHLYWDEFCFRWNLSSQLLPVIPALAEACLSRSMLHYNHRLQASG